MKKILSTIIALFVSIIFATNSFAQAITYNPPVKTVVVKSASSPNADSTFNLRDVKCISKAYQDEVSIFVDSYKNYKVFTLTNPYRIVVDIPNTTAPAKQQTVDFQSKVIKTVRYAQFDNGTARIVLELAGSPQYKVAEKKGKLVLYVINPITQNAVYYVDEDKAYLILPTVKLVDNSDIDKKLYTETRDTVKKKYTIMYPNTLGQLSSKTAIVKDEFLNSIQILNYRVTKKTKITFNAKDELLFEYSATPDGKGTVIKMAKTVIVDRGGDEDRDPAAVLDVACASDGGTDTITITTANYSGYNVMRITDPDRIVIDIPNVKTSKDQMTISVDSSYVKAVRYAQFGSTTARVVIDTKGLPPYQVSEEQGRLVFNIQKPTYKNITYSSNGDRRYFLLNGATLTEGGANLKRYYTGSFDSGGMKYTMTFDSGRANIGTGVMKINDSLLDSIEIAYDGASKKTSITFNAKDKFVYETITRSDVNDTAITLLKPAAKQDRLVVIDAGHGGPEPGAVYGGVQEKTLNLAIALKLNALLKDRNIKTYMTREDDSFVGLYERAYIANDLNAALFLCVHNNAFNKSEKGTETLYFPGRANENGFTGKGFAQIIQEALVGTLGTKNRGIVERPGLVVLKATKMPASLAEIGFITNDDERVKLLDDTFQQNAAQALCDAVIKALGQN